MCLKRLFTDWKRLFTAQKRLFTAQKQLFMAWGYFCRIVSLFLITWHTFNQSMNKNIWMPYVTIGYSIWNPYTPCRRFTMGLLHCDPIKIHPFCLGFYFKTYLIRMKNCFIITVSRVQSFIGEILGNIHRGVLEKSRILQEESILPHSNGIYYSNSHVHLWTCVMKLIRLQHRLNNGQNKFYSWIKTFFQEINYKTTTKQAFRIWLSHLMVWQYFSNHNYFSKSMLWVKIFLWFQLKR